MGEHLSLMEETWDVLGEKIVENGSESLDLNVKAYDSLTCGESYTYDVFISHIWWTVKMTGS